MLIEFFIFAVFFCCAAFFIALAAETVISIWGQP